MPDLLELDLLELDLVELDLLELEADLVDGCLFSPSGALSGVFSKFKIAE